MTLDRRCDSDNPAVPGEVVKIPGCFLPVAVTRIVFSCGARSVRGCRARVFLNFALASVTPLR